MIVEKCLIGFPWSFEVTATNPDASAVNLTTFVPSAEFWQQFNSQSQATILTIANGGISIIDAVNGKFLIFVSAALSAQAIAQNSTAATYPTRILPYTTDNTGLQTPLTNSDGSPGFIYIVPLSPRTA